MSGSNQSQRLYVALRRIASYQTPTQLRRHCKRDYGLDYCEALEYAYDNVLQEARGALRGTRKPANSPNAPPDGATEEQR